MPSLARGESSTSSNLVLDLFTSVGSVLTDVATLQYRVFDISTPTKRGVPVQVFPTTAGQWEDLDPTLDAPTGHRVGVGHYYAPFVVGLGEPIGDHKIEWRFQATTLSPWDLLAEEFYVAEGTTPNAVTYCTVADLRAEGFNDPPFTDARIEKLCILATKYIDKTTGRWFTPRTFTEAAPLRVDGGSSRTLHLDIPIIRLDAAQTFDGAFLDGQLSDIDLLTLSVYNRHLTGLTMPDDRENPRITFRSSGVLGWSRFPQGAQNVYLQGVFGYTDPDGSEFGETPLLIRQAAVRLVARDLDLESEGCAKVDRKNKWRIASDHEGSTSVSLQALWLKGAFTGDSEIDNVLMMYKRPPRMAVI